MGEVIRIDTSRVEALELDGELIAVDLNRAVYMGGNRAAAVLWPALTQGTTREELADRLVERFGIDRAAAQADVDSFLETLAGQGLLAD